MDTAHSVKILLVNNPITEKYDIKKKMFTLQNKTKLFVRFLFLTMQQQTDWQKVSPNLMLGLLHRDFTPTTQPRHCFRLTHTHKYVDVGTDFFSSFFKILFNASVPRYLATAFPRDLLTHFCRLTDLTM